MINVHMATKDQPAAVLALYGECGYHGGLQDQDLILVAETSVRVVGVLRLCGEGDAAVLRGFFIVPEHRGQGVGAQMLRTLVLHLGERCCYCIPFDHLTGFYGSVGFSPVNPTTAPLFLTKRLARYRAEGHQVILMARPWSGREAT